MDKFLFQAQKNSFHSLVTLIIILNHYIFNLKKSSQPQIVSFRDFKKGSGQFIKNINR